MCMQVPWQTPEETPASGLTGMLLRYTLPAALFCPALRCAVLCCAVLQQLMIKATQDRVCACARMCVCVCVGGGGGGVGEGISQLQHS